MASAITDLMDRVTDSSTGRPVIAQLAAPGKAIGAATINLDSATNWTTTTAIHFSIYNTITVGTQTVKDPTTQTDWKGTLAGTAIGSLTLTGGTDREYTAGAIVELTPTARYAKDLHDLLSTLFNQDASLKPGPIQTALNLGSASLNGWNVLGATISAVTYNGNRSYDLTTTTDQTGTLNPGMRFRTTRGTVAPIQCTSLNGTTQYYSKATPNGMTFTDDFVVSAWVKLSSYPSAAAGIVSRYNGTSGWALRVDTTGEVQLIGYNGGAANLSYVQSYQSLPLNKWVHVSAQLDMSAFTATTTTSYIMVDGVDIPSVVVRIGTNPTALIQAGNLEIGSVNATGFFPGKIAQAFVSSAKITQANVRTLISQGLTSALITANSIVSAYSFDNSVNDLNTTSANNLTASGAATATNADSPFGGQASGSISSTLDYAIIQKVTSTTITVQVAEGCTIPTSGTITAASYATDRSPYGFPGQRDKWQIVSLNCTDTNGGAVTVGTVANVGSLQLNIPLGSWEVGGTFTGRADYAGVAVQSFVVAIDTASTGQTDRELKARFDGNSVVVGGTATLRAAKTLNTATLYFLNIGPAGNNSTSLYLLGSTAANKFTAENAYL